MQTSQNLRFTASGPKDPEFGHPPGASLMRGLSRELAAAGWKTDAMDNWRDCGWSIVCSRESSKLETVLSWVERGYWMLQVSPMHAPGSIRRLFGAQPSATSIDVYQLALAIHNALSELRYLEGPRWRWDGVPDEQHSTQEPQPA